MNTAPHSIFTNDSVQSNVNREKLNSSSNASPWGSSNTFSVPLRDIQKEQQVSTSEKKSIQNEIPVDNRSSLPIWGSQQHQPKRPTLQEIQLEEERQRQIEQRGQYEEMRNQQMSHS